MKQRLLYLLPLAGFLAIAGYFAYGLTLNPQELPSALIDKPAPTFELAPLDDRTPGLATADLAGEPVALVNFFASWCVPCRAEHPILTRLAEVENVPLYGIAYKDEIADSIGFLNELGNPYDRIGVDQDGRAAIEFGVYGVPETYVIDRDGHIRFRHAGALTRQIIERDIMPLIEELRK
ncbi:MAG: DsbE family thiol:disulfide interchange protein [Alphaproteobacteria bacterium]|nr:DsbE family thiol:disulfide interchange protein [Alphaproteobacteria bacterium]